MVFDDDELACAIILFDDNGALLREMLYSEFEAILENYVLAHEWAARVLKAAFVQVDSQYHIRSAVFFHVEFTATGAISQDWNLPLEQLASNAADGPDLGYGAIRMACQSQCPIDHFAHGLWDPSLSKTKGHLACIKKAIDLNGLAIQFKAPDQSAGQFQGAGLSALAHSQLNQANEQAIAHVRSHTAQLLKEQRLKMRMLDKAHKNQLKETKAEASLRINEYRDHIDTISGMLDEEKSRTQELKNTIEGQANKIEGLREYFEHKLEQQEGQETEDLAHIKQSYDTEMEAKVAAVTSQFKEQLNAREVELLYLKEKSQQLQEEIIRLREENKEYLANSGDSILSKMAMKGISFVAYQSGAGHITLPQSEISRYMDNPVRYAAQICGVTQDHYLAWLQHYQTPVCRDCDENDTICGANLERIEQPAEFRVSIDDRCSKHNHKKPSLKLAGS